MLSLLWPWRSAPPFGWLAADAKAHHLTGLVRMLCWRPWAEAITEIAVAFGEAERSPINVSFQPDQQGLWLESELSQFELERRAGEVVSILVTNNLNPHAGWWWLDLELVESDPSFIYQPTSSTRALTLEEAQFISQHPAPEELL